MKSILKEFIPPILLNFLQNASESKEHVIFESYQDALQHCTNSAYEEEELIQVILKKTKKFVSTINMDVVPIWETSAYSLFSLLNPIIERKGAAIHVLDFGGACGAHYFHLRKLINAAQALNWVVVETPTMVKHAKELETSELSFVDNFDDALAKLGHVDLLHTSGTLQCVNNPKDYLTKILDCNPAWILFNRLGLNKREKDIVTIHSSKLSWNGIGELPKGHTDRWVKYPFTFISETTSLNLVKENYAVVAKFDDLSGMYPVKNEEILGYGLLCQRNRGV